MQIKLAKSVLKPLCLPACLPNITSCKQRLLHTKHLSLALARVFSLSLAGNALQARHPPWAELSVSHKLSCVCMLGSGGALLPPPRMAWSANNSANIIVPALNAAHLSLRPFILIRADALPALGPFSPKGNGNWSDANAKTHPLRWSRKGPML